MSKLIDDFAEIRKKQTPWVLVRTPDVWACIAQLLGVKRTDDEDTPPAVVWDCVNGPATPVEAGDDIESAVAENITPESEGNFVPSGNPIQDLPQTLVNARKKLGEGTILFLICQDNTILEYAPVAQAIHGLRDAFKTSFRTLVILGQDPRVPPFLAEDMPIIDDPLPSVDELRDMALLIAKDNEVSAANGNMANAGAACRGMTRFASETALKRKLRKSGYDLKALTEVRRLSIEATTNRALVFERETWSFEDVGGLQEFKAFMTGLFNGPKKPQLIVRIDEIDKDITSASTGTVADNTGVSQAILKSLLTCIEDNKWMGLLAVGGPGTGKTLASICTGNHFGCTTMALNISATKGSLVGQTETAMRRVMDIIYTTGGENVLFIATCNRLDTMPPELQRRFWLGTWFWDLPNSDERNRIWQIQKARFGIKEEVTFGHDGWTGSDIRNACQMAWATASSLKDAAGRITLVGQTNRDQIEKLRDMAERLCFRSANYPGAFKKAKPTAKRQVNLN